MNKQEQIEKMMLDVPQTIAAYDANPKGQHLYGEQRLQIAEVLYDKGYGNVSEYKAEIERLKADKKQAQIDVLNKVKEHLFFGVSLGFLRLYVDELIEEVEKQ